MEVSMEDGCLLGYTPSSLVEVHKRFSGSYCFHNRGYELAMFILAAV